MRGGWGREGDPLPLQLHIRNSRLGGVPVYLLVNSSWEIADASHQLKFLPPPSPHPILPHICPTPPHISASFYAPTHPSISALYEGWRQKLARKPKHFPKKNNFSEHFSRMYRGKTRNFEKEANEEHVQFAHHSFLSAKFSHHLLYI